MNSLQLSNIVSVFALIATFPPVFVDGSFSISRRGTSFMLPLISGVLFILYKYCS